MQKTNSVPSLITSLELMINSEKLDFLETSRFLCDLVFCDAEDYDIIELLQHGTE